MSAEGSQAPISLHDYMAAANAAYYAARDPLGVEGDFITAPEISQMFGELIGLWCADLCARAAPSAPPCYVELGPGRGTLAMDALRAMARAGYVPAVHLVETSPALRARQAERIPHAHWHETIESLPTDTPLIVIANEFFDALPIRQFQRTAGGWRERMVAGRAFTLGGDAGEEIALSLADSPMGSIVERNPAGEAIMARLGARIARQGGAILAIDYGYEGPATGDTLQAVARHGYAAPLEAPGTRDLTAHVDFGALALIAHMQGLRPLPCIGQGAFLRALGIDARAASLARANPARGEALARERDRLVEDKQMGRLFKIFCAVNRDWPLPAGFA